MWNCAQLRDVASDQARAFDITRIRWVNEPGSAFPAFTRAFPPAVIVWAQISYKTGRDMKLARATFINIHPTMTLGVCASAAGAHVDHQVRRMDVVRDRSAHRRPLDFRNPLP